MDDNIGLNGNIDYKTLGLFFFQSMKKYRNNVFQYMAETGKTNSYGELLTRCVRVALNLRDRGVDKNDIISTCSPNSENNCIPTIATQFLGAKSANFDPNLPQLDTIHLLDLMSPKVIFVSQDSLSFMENCLEQINKKVEMVVIGTSDKYEQFSDYLVPHHEENEFKPVFSLDDKETAVIMFSSGTTGFPKGICLSHHSLLFTNDKSSSASDENSETVPWILLSFSNLYWISALGFLIMMMRNGSARVVCHEFNAVVLWKLIDEFKINLLFLPTYQAVEFLEQRSGNYDTSSLKIFVTGTCFVPEKLLTDLRKALPETNIINGYGQTEMAGGITLFDVSIPEELAMQEKKPQSCGRMRKGCEWKVVDLETEEILGPNQEGELRLKSHLVMNGYYKMDSSSAFDKDGYLKTGDIVWYDEDECFYIVDRIKEIFKYRGWHILPAMLEKVLMTHPAVKEAAVVSVHHEIDGDHPMGLIVLFEGHENITSEDIKLFFEAKVADSQKLRGGLRIVKELEKTVTGKIKRRALAQMVSNGQIKYINN